MEGKLLFSSSVDGTVVQLSSSNQVHDTINVSNSNTLKILDMLCTCICGISYTAWRASLFSVMGFKKESADYWDRERAGCAEGLR